jgi:tungstate transport system permease protein
MDLIIEGIKQAFLLLIKGDPDLTSITLNSIRVSGSAILISMLIGMPLGLFVALSDFPGRRLIVASVNTGMGLPPVVVGLAVAILFWHNSGLLGFFDIMYSKTAMIIAQVIIAFPIVAGLTLAAVQQLDPKLSLQSLALGASRVQLLVTLIKEARLATLAAIMAGFGGVISEVGAVMMVGGDIKGDTRLLTTAILAYVRQGDFGMAIALSIILMAFIFAVNLVLTNIQQKGETPWISHILK